MVSTSFTVHILSFVKATQKRRYRKSVSPHKYNGTDQKILASGETRFLSGLQMNSILASLSMSPDTVLSRIGFSEMVRLWEQKFLVYRSINESISSNHLNLSFPRFSSVIAFVHGSIQFTAPFSHRKPFIPLSAGIQPLACAALLLTHTGQKSAPPNESVSHLLP